MVNHQYAFVRRGSMVTIVAYLNSRAHSVHSVPASSYVRKVKPDYVVYIIVV